MSIFGKNQKAGGWIKLMGPLLDELDRAAWHSCVTTVGLIRHFGLHCHVGDTCHRIWPPRVPLFFNLFAGILYFPESLVRASNCD